MGEGEEGVRRPGSGASLRGAHVQQAEGGPAHGARGAARQPLRRRAAGARRPPARYAAAAPQHAATRHCSYTAPHRVEPPARGSYRVN